MFEPQQYFRLPFHTVRVDTCCECHGTFHDCSVLTAAGPAWVVFMEGSWERKPAAGDPALSWEAGARWGRGLGLRCCRRTRAAAGVQAGGSVCQGCSAGRPWPVLTSSPPGLSLDSSALHPQCFPLLSFLPPSIQDFLAFFCPLLFSGFLSPTHTLIYFFVSLTVLFSSFLFSLWTLFFIVAKYIT